METRAALFLGVLVRWMTGASWDSPHWAQTIFPGLSYWWTYCFFQFRRRYARSPTYFGGGAASENIKTTSPIILYLCANGNFVCSPSRAEKPPCFVQRSSLTHSNHVGTCLREFHGHLQISISDQSQTRIQHIFCHSTFYMRRICHVTLSLAWTSNSTVKITPKPKLDLCPLDRHNAIFARLFKFEDTWNTNAFFLLTTHWSNRRSWEDFSLKSQMGDICGPYSRLVI